VRVGDRVLVKLVGLKGKQKLANIWEDAVFTVLEQTSEDIPVFVVQREDKKGKKRTLHRNMLLPVNFLPLERTPDQPQEKTTRDTSRTEVPVDMVETSSESSEEEDDVREISS